MLRVFTVVACVALFVCTDAMESPGESHDMGYAKTNKKVAARKKTVRGSTPAVHPICRIADIYPNGCGGDDENVCLLETFLNEKSLEGVENGIQKGIVKAWQDPEGGAVGLLSKTGRRGEPHVSCGNAAKILSFATVPKSYNLKSWFEVNLQFLGKKIPTKTKNVPRVTTTGFCSVIEKLANDPFYKNHAVIMPFTVHWTAQDNHIFTLLKRRDGSFRLLQAYIGAFSLDEFIAGGSEHVQGCSTDIDQFCKGVEQLTATNHVFDITLFNKLFNIRGSKQQLATGWDADDALKRDQIVWQLRGPTPTTGKKGLILAFPFYLPGDKSPYKEAERRRQGGKEVAPVDDWARILKDELERFFCDLGSHASSSSCATL